MRDLVGGNRDGGFDGLLPSVHLVRRFEIGCIGEVLVYDAQTVGGHPQ